jgi:hypothetical protein
LAAPVPLAKKRGVILSIAVDCNILGAASMLPRAELRVAPHIPAITSSGTRAILNNAFGSVAKSSPSTVKAKKNARQI